MSFLPILNYRELKAILNALGYFEVRQKGSHVIFESQSKERIIVPKHRGKTIGKGLLRSIIRDLDISVIEFIRLHKNK